MGNENTGKERDIKIEIDIERKIKIKIKIEIEIELHDTYAAKEPHADILPRQTTRAPKDPT